MIVKMVTIESINAAATAVTAYVPVALVLIGVFGNVFNIIIFTRPSLNKSPCTIYLLGASIASLIFICFVAPSSTSMGFYGYDFRAYNLALCRIYYFFIYVTAISSSWFLVLASFDRFCVTSQNMKIRNLSNVVLARRLSITIAIIILLSYCHLLILFQVKQTPAGLSCRPQDGVYRGFLDFFYFATFSFTPPLLLIAAFIGTISQLWRSRNRIVATTTASDSNATNVHRLKNKDRRLVFMILFQIVAKVILTSPHAIQKFYTFFAPSESQNSLKTAILNFITQFSRQLIIMDCCIPFFL